MTNLDSIFGEGNGNPLQYSCLENPMGGGAWWAAIHGVAKSWTWLSNFSFTFHFHALEKEVATHSSRLAWRIPGTGEPGGLPPMGSHRVGHDWSDLAAADSILKSRDIILPKKLHLIKAMVFPVVMYGCESWTLKKAEGWRIDAFELLLLLLLSRFSCVRLCATPKTAAHQAPLSLGFSRQEHWSGLPFPSPMHASEKRKWNRSVMSDSSRPHGLQPTRLLHPWDFPGKSTGVGC